MIWAESTWVSVLRSMYEVVCTVSMLLSPLPPSAAIARVVVSSSCTASHLPAYQRARVPLGNTGPYPIQPLPTSVVSSAATGFFEK